MHSLPGSAIYRAMKRPAIRKPGRQPIPASRRRAHPVRVYLRPDEARTVARACRILGMPESAWSRDVLLQRARDIIAARDAMREREPETL